MGRAETAIWRRFLALAAIAGALLALPGAALAALGQLYSFGFNYYGELGVGTNDKTETGIPTPQLVSLPGGAKADTAASGFGGHSLVVVADVSAALVGERAAGRARDRRRWRDLRDPDRGGRLQPDGDRQRPLRGHGVEDAGADHPAGLRAFFGARVEGGPPPARPEGEPAELSLAGRRVGGKCEAVTAANRAKPSCRRKLELPLGLNLDADAALRIELARLTPGRVLRGRCLKPSDANRRRPSCNRATAVGRPSVEQAQAGADTVTIAGPALAPGRYEVTVTPYAGGQEGELSTTTFTAS